MTFRQLALSLLVVGWIAPALAAGSSSSSSSSTQSSSSTDFDRAVTAVNNGNFTTALTLLNKVVSKDPGNADAWNYIGFSRRNLKQFDQALAAYDKALSIDPNHRGANEYLGELYLKTGKLDKAKERLAKLDKLCLLGCDEYDDLAKAIKAFETTGNSG